MSSSKILLSNTSPKLKAPADIFDDAREFVGGTSPAAWWLRCELAPMVSQLIDLVIRSFVERLYTGAVCSFKAATVPWENGVKGGMKAISRSSRDANAAYLVLLPSVVLFTRDFHPF